MATLTKTFTQKHTENGVTDTYTFNVVFTITETATQYTYKYTSLTVTRTKTGSNVKVAFIRDSDEKGGSFTFSTNLKTQTVTNSNGWFSGTVNKTHSSQTVNISMDACVAHRSADYTYYSKTYSMTVPAKTSYTVTYNANDGSGAPSAQTKWYNEALTLSSSKPTKSGYTFKGWATSTANASAGTVNYASGATYSSNAAVTLYAVWELTYSKPSITNLSVERCDQDGTDNDEGGYASVTFDWSVFQSASARYYGGSTYPYSSNTVDTCTVTVGTFSATPTLSGASGTETVVVGDGSFSTDTQYSASVEITDTQTIAASHTTTVTGTLAKSAFPMDFNATGEAVGFFMPAPDNGSGMYVGGDVDIASGASYKINGVNILTPVDVAATITTSIGSVSGDITCKRLGNLFYLSFVAAKTTASTIAVGSNLFEGTLSANARGGYARSTTLNSGNIFAVVLNSDGTIYIRNTGSGSVSGALSMRLAFVYMI